MSYWESLQEGLKDKMPAEALQIFLAHYHKYKLETIALSPWETIATPDDKLLPRYDSLPQPSEESVRNALECLIICKLNGGLGTTMGCEGPKSSIIVRDGLSFLDIIVKQLNDLMGHHRISVPLFLMNSFYTHEETLRMLDKYRDGLYIDTFLQNCFPRIRVENDTLLDESEFGVAAWYPPGHGDFFDCIYHQGLLDRWLREGRKLLFISNSDNLGASVDERIASWMLESGCSFLMEVTDKTSADVKGGTLYQEAGGLRLLEVAQVSPENLDEFCNTEKFKIFNTNNIWINLVHLKDRYEKGVFRLPVIVNPKNIHGVDVVQLETAMGFGIDNFLNSVGLVVPRRRYLPVKKTSDLFLAQSDLFLLKDGHLIRNPARSLSDLPNIQFGSDLAKLSDYEEKISEIPSIIDLESLQIEGDVRFGKGVVMKGKVMLSAKNYALTVSANSFIDNEEIIN